MVGVACFAALVAANGATTQSRSGECDLKRTDVVFAVVLGLALGWWYWKDQVETPRLPPPQAPKALAHPSVKVLPAPPHSAPSSTVAPSPPAVQEPSSTPKQPASGQVEFEIREGVAVTQGDMVLGKLTDPESKITQGVTGVQRTRLWPSNQIPYSIQEGALPRAAIQAAIDQFHAQTNVRFVPYTGQADSLVFTSATELCASYLGRIGGGQPIYLSPKCGTNEVMHELMHALGFVHEHSRPDRDQFLEVVWNNIDTVFWPQFWIIPEEFVHDYTGAVFSFDPQSIMLYEPTAFAKQAGQPTLRAKGNQELRPSRGAFSRTDRERLFYLYGQ
jgi:hypothetical protein